MRTLYVVKTSLNTLAFMVFGLALSVILLHQTTPLRQAQASTTSLTPLPFTLTSVLGQPDFKETMINRITADRAFHVGGIHVDPFDHIYVVDSGNNRILGFQNYTGQNKDAILVLGQPALVEKGTANGDNTAFQAPTAATLALEPYPYTVSTLESPRALSLSSDSQGNLYVPDLNNNRVLKYNSPFTTDTVADDVWGQPNFTTRQSYCGQSGFAPTAQNLCLEWASPAHGTSNQVFMSGVDVDSAGNLWVADTGNNRVLRFAPGSKTANLVLGQTNFSSNTARGSFDHRLDKLNKPIAVRVKPSTGEIYVLEGEWAGENRIVVFPASVTNGASATREIGRAFSQPTQPSSTLGWENIRGNWVDISTGLYWSRGFVFDPTGTGDVWVNDGRNNRLVLFDSAGVINTSNIIGQPNAELTTCEGLTGQGYQQVDGTKNSLCNNDGEIGLDSRNNIYVGKTYFPQDVARFALPLVRNVSNQNLVISNGWLVHGDNGRSWNTFSGSTFLNMHGLSISDSTTPQQAFVSDGQRILVWNNYLSAITYQSANYVIGQDLFTTNYNDNGIFGGLNLGAQAVGGGHLFVSANDRIFIFSLPITHSGRNYPIAKVLYRGSYSDGNVFWADDGTKVDFNITGLLFDPNTNSLWASDSDNNRVLHIKDPLGPATVDLVLGQPNKSTTADNAGTDRGARGFGNVWNLEYDKLGNLYVVDSIFEGWANGTNNRVLRFAASDLNPTPGNIFPFPSATGVYAKDSFSDDLSSTEGMPNTPTSVSFDSQNRMYLTVDSYGNPQHERLFVYPSTHTTTMAPTPDSVIQIPFGQAAHVLVTPDDNHLIIQDHTWNRLLFVEINPPTNTPAPTTVPPTATPVPPTATPIPPTASPTRPPTVPTPVPGANLIINPGFESDSNLDGKPDNWNPTNWRFVRSNQTTLNGSYAGKHVISNNSTYSVTQPSIVVTAGKTYSMSASTNIPPTSDSFSFKIEVLFKKPDGSTHSKVLIKNYNSATSGWDRVQSNVVVPTGVTRAQIVMTATSLNAEVFVDQFDLHLIN